MTMRSYYDPNLTLPPGEPYYAPTATAGAWDMGPVAMADALSPAGFAWDDSPEALSEFYGTEYDWNPQYVISGPVPAPSLASEIEHGLENFGHEIGHFFDRAPAGGIGQGLSGISHGIGKGVSQLPNVAQTIVQSGESARKAGAAADEVQKQASQVGDDAHRALTETEEAAKAVKYVAYGLGGLAALALVVTIVKSAID